MADNFFSKLFRGKKATETPSKDGPAVATEPRPAPESDARALADNSKATDTPAPDIMGFPETVPAPHDAPDGAWPEDAGATPDRPVDPDTDPAHAPATDDVTPGDRAGPDERPPVRADEPVAVADTPPSTGAGEAVPGEKAGWFARLKQGLSRSSSRLSDGVTSIFVKRKLDDDTIEELQDLLIAADLGVSVSAKVITTLARDKFDKEISDRDVRIALAGVVAETLRPLQVPLTIDPSRRPFVVLMVGVNGAGKTTTIGKIAARLKAEGRSVMMAAGDTFRAAAIEQLQAWGTRTEARVISGNEGADAAGLAFDALKEAMASGTDVLLVDTAGRLQNRRELMDELAKVVRVLKKLDPEAPHATLLTLDATVGQNALSQVQAFRDIADVSGLIMTKLDGTARGGVLVAIADRYKLPIHYVGVGEGVEDLQPFDANAFARALAGVGPPA